MTIIGMLKMNYMIIGLMSLDMCFKRWNVVQYVESLNWKININIFKNKKMHVIKIKMIMDLLLMGLQIFYCLIILPHMMGGGGKNV